ncbi:MULTISPECIES: hypothetical protein [unclassified Paenibacillus]|uniref:hypothetical protein n=1 Tax=unclassified Paenibacillus TaxID=185978 RepID=UPI0008CB09E5|nr:MULTISPECIES: hypothetical protein [unclassified Paenibacillus]QLG38136.1 XRE family transcriptional regulator [Paenibacillus sp. E222]SEO64118.1 hypothetical protein SAMN05518670_4500 [Paenibacillus sp. OK076]
MVISIKIRLDYTLDAASVTKNALAREAKVRPNLIYDLCERKTKRLEINMKPSPSDFKEKHKQTVHFTLDGLFGFLLTLVMLKHTK